MTNDPHDEMAKNRKMGEFFARLAEKHGGVHPDPIWEPIGNNGAHAERDADERAKIYQPKPPSGF